MNTLCLITWNVWSDIVKIIFQDISLFLYLSLCFYLTNSVILNGACFAFTSNISIFFITVMVCYQFLVSSFIFLNISIMLLMNIVSSWSLRPTLFGVCVFVCLLFFLLYLCFFNTVRFFLSLDIPLANFRREKSYSHWEAGLGSWNTGGIKSLCCGNVSSPTTSFIIR